MALVHPVAELAQHDTAEAELEILKSAYRLDGDGHAALAGVAHVLAGKLGLDCDVVLYQALNDAGSDRRNAGVTVLGDTAHVVFAGDLLSLLDLQEQEVVLAHELAHVWLFRHDAGAVLAKVGIAGNVCLFTLTETDLIVDVNGYVPKAA